MIKWLIGLVVLIALAIIGIGWYLAPDDLASCHEQVSSAPNCRPVDAIVAISGGNTSARAEEAITLYQHGFSKRLIFSGAAKDTSGPSNAMMMEVLAERAGVPASAIEIDESADTTEQNAQDSEKIFEQDNIHSIILVTSGYHQRRASLEFHKFTSGVLIENHPAANDSDWQWYWWATPRGWWLAGGELVKIVAFYLGINS